MKMTKNIAGLGLAGLIAMSAAAGMAGAAPAEAGITKCKTLGVVTDSTGLSLLGADGAKSLQGDRTIERDGGYKSNTDILGTQVSKVGVTDLVFDAVAGRSFVEGNPGDLRPLGNGVEALKSVEDKDVDCHLVLMGTNDAANVAGGANVQAPERIERALATTEKPVLWVNPVVTSGSQATHYTTEGTKKFSEALTKAEDQHKNLKVIDIDLDDDMFTDGIHPGTEGQKVRAKAIAEALTEKPFVKS